MTLKIYGYAKSRAIRNIWMANELGLRYEHVPLDLAEAKEPSFLAINPAGQVPAIDDDGVVLTESAAINLYLAKKAGSPLYPTAPNDEAKVWQWCFWAMTQLEPPLIAILRNRVMLPPEKRSEAAAAEGERQVQAPLALLDQALARTGYLVGNGFTVADLTAASVLLIARGLKLDLAAYKNVGRWLEASLSRPAAREALKLRQG
jgi:glutathione S-transferase